MRENHNSSLVFKGTLFNIIREPYIAIDGSVEYFEFAETNDVVRVYPVTDHGKLLLISEDRYGIAPDSISKVLRVVSGAIEPNESPEAAAIRELGEEIGFSGENPVIFHTSYPMLKVRSKVFHVLVKAKGLLEVGPQPDRFEHIKMIPLKIEDVEAKVWNGDFAEDIVAFGLLKMLHYLHSKEYAGT